MRVCLQVFYSSAWNLLLLLLLGHQSPCLRGRFTLFFFFYNCFGSRKYLWSYYFLLYRAWFFQQLLWGFTSTIRRTELFDNNWKLTHDLELGTKLSFFSGKKKLRDNWNFCRSSIILMFQPQINLIFNKWIHLKSNF